MRPPPHGVDPAGAIMRALQNCEANVQDRILNFLNNWIDANIIHASHEPGDASTMQYRFLTDAVAAGFALEEVNEEWAQAEIEIRKAFYRPRSD
jgi:hypothetical protein